MNSSQTDGTGGSRARQIVDDDNFASSLLPLDEDVWARMEHAYRHGLPKGETCHIKELDPHFKWMPGYLNVWTGWMNDGKTEWVYQLLLLRAVLAGKRSAIYSPENMTEEFIYNQLIHSLTGQNPDRDWKECLALDRYKRASEFVREFFIVVYPPKGQARTPKYLLECFEDAIARHHVSHCLLDPWNKADHSAMNSMGGIEAYLVNTLGMITDWTVDTKQSLTITAHPRQLPDMKFGQARWVPDSSHISGGQTWENMAHLIATYYRPYKHEGKQSDRYTDVAIYVHKVKSAKLVGIRGSIGTDSENPDVRITYDWRTARYTIADKTPLDCREAEECYLSDADLRARDDMRGSNPAPMTQPLTATPATPDSSYAPTPKAPRPPEPAPSLFTPGPDDIPANWTGTGTRVTLPQQPSGS